MQSTVKKIKYYNCGYCTNNLRLIFKGHKKQIVKFPAGTFLIEHSKEGYILFDTGYSTDIYNSGFVGKLYNLFNPTFVQKEDEVAYQLEQNDIKPEDIKYIILSHLHPDHIGCLKYYKKSKIIISEDAYKSYKNSKLRDLIFKNMIPKWFEENLLILDDNKLKEKNNKYFSYYDLFNDNSILVTKLNGHAKGQICCLVNNKVFLGADSSWGNKFVGQSNNFRIFPKLIQWNMKEYQRSEIILQKIKSDNIKLCFSHDTYDCEELLYE